MPSFVANGPFVPDQLVQQLEEDRVVIFCGAGISMGAGLPSYAGLVEYCYEELGEPLPPRKSTDWLWPDRMLGSAENRYTPAAVRRRVVERLDRPPTDLSLHRAIVRLATLRNGNGIRLVTTNFDTFFEQAQSGLLLGRDFHSGPVLPIPRNDRIVSWKSIVYLHGRLAPAEESNDHLVLTSADFGRAYLTEAWAARFVARLFADFTVLFIGYSLNDPVLRYMTDAFAAEDHIARRQTPRGPAYIFLPYRGASLPDARSWRERNLEPIFYNQARDHLQLRRTLIAWADARQDYLSNTRVLIERIAPTPPDAQHPSDVDNLLWAIAGRADDAGHGARVFAAISPPAPLQWLIALDRKEHQQADSYRTELARARLDGSPEPELPASQLATLFPLVSNERVVMGDTARHLIPWLVEHLSDPELIDWVIGRLNAGRRAHVLFRQAIRERLQEGAPMAQGTAKFWRIVSAEGNWAIAPLDRRAAWHLPRMLRAEPNAASTQLELAEAFRPSLVLSPSFLRHWRDDDEDAEVEPIGSRFSQIADAEVRLADEDQVPAIIDAVDQLANADAFWADRLDMLTTALKDALELFATAGEAGPDYDPSIVRRPSIQPHSQNNHHHNWLWLFDLIWRGWQYIDGVDPAASRAWVEHWRRIPFIAFRRLSLAAITVSGSFSAEYKLEVLLHG